MHLLFYFSCVFCLLVVLVWLSVPVQVIDWKLERLISKMTMYNVLNPTHSLGWLAGWGLTALSA